MKTYKVTVDKDGNTHWYCKNKLHREGGPAIESTNDDKSWWLNNKLHREDGPAIEYVDGTKQWFLNGEKLTEAQFNARTKKQPTCDGKVVEIDGKKYKLQEVK